MDNKDNSPEFRASILSEIESWTKPTNKLERDLAKILTSKKPIEVYQPPNTNLIELGMRPQDCYTNCALYISLKKDAKIITGWWVKDDAYILHSVVKTEGMLICVTPWLEEEGGMMQFIKHTRISWEETPNGVVPHHQKYGFIPEIVRVDPVNTIKESLEIKRLILEGMPPIEAHNLVKGITTHLN